MQTTASQSQALVSSAMTEDGFTIHDTAGKNYEASTWVEPGEGMRVRGTLVRAFLIPPQFGDTPQVAYEFRDTEGKLFCLGEKAAMRKVMRKSVIGTEFRITFGAKVPVRDGKFEAYQVNIESRNPPKNGLVVSSQLKALWADMQASGDDLPF